MRVASTFAIGASYAGKCTVTITSGPGYSLKQEAIGLAVMIVLGLLLSAMPVITIARWKVTQRPHQLVVEQHLDPPDALVPRAEQP